MTLKRRSLQVERLEARELMAGDIAASLVNGSLYVSEAAGQTGLDNSVMISQLPGGLIRVGGNSTSDGTFSRINGAAYQDFAVQGNLYVSFGGGSDLVVIQPDANGNAPSFGDVQINVARQQPLVAARTLDSVIATPFNTPDKDNVIVWGLNVRGSMTVTTGDDNDWVFLGGTQIAGNLNVYSGAGADTVTLKSATNVYGNAYVQTYGYVTENDADVVWLENMGIKGNLQAVLGGGNDLFHLSNGHVLKTLNLDAGTGDDSAEFLDGAVVDELFAQLGDGNDVLSADRFYGRAFHFLGGAGSDNLKRTSAIYGQVVEQTGWECINGRLQLAVAGGATLAKAKAF